MRMSDEKEPGHVTLLRESASHRMKEARSNAARASQAYRQDGPWKTAADRLAAAHLECARVWARVLIEIQHADAMLAERTKGRP